jgi:hypothetical protein
MQLSSQGAGVGGVGGAAGAGAVRALLRGSGRRSRSRSRSETILISSKGNPQIRFIMQQEHLIALSNISRYHSHTLNTYFKEYK